MKIDKKKDLLSIQKYKEKLLSHIIKIKQKTIIKRVNFIIPKKHSNNTLKCYPQSTPRE